MNVEINCTRALPSEQQMADCGFWIMVLPDGLKPAEWPAVPFRDLLARRRTRLLRAPSSNAIVTDLPNDSRVVLAMVEIHKTQFELLSLARRLVAKILDHDPGEVGICVAGFKSAAAEQCAEALLAALLAGAADLPDYRSKKSPTKPADLERIAVYGSNPRHRFRRTFAEAEGSNLVRDLATLPANELTPRIYRQRLAKLARTHGWRMEFTGVDRLAKRGAGAFLAVTQASPDKDAGIVRLRYRPARGKRRVSLVGKGICYDTGGVNIKSARYMLGMHEDMTGSAVALGTLLALTRLNVPFEADAWLALATNHVGPLAYKPNDVVTASDGTSIEVIHSDAEGRMVLADTLVMATRTRPHLVVDYATLTGSCIQALGKAYSGVFTNRPELEPWLVAAGRDSGERVWPFPLDEDYDQALQSQVADIKQCAPDGGADHILAARFLQRFVKHDVPWVHIDLSSSNRKGGLAHVPTDTTGFGVRFTLNFLLDKKVF